jgi:hypothetical protein
MKSVRGIALGVAALALIVVLMAPAANSVAAGAPKTVGDFLTAYARALNIELPANAAPEAVVETLRATGVKLDAKIDTNAPLTQGDVVKIGRANGIHITTQTASKPFTAEEMNQFFTSYSATIAQANASSTLVAGQALGGRRDARENTRNPYRGKGKGKHKGHNSPDEPDDHDDHGQGDAHSN